MENIAERIRQDRRPEGEMFDLAGEARRLSSSLAVAQRWYEVALEGDETGHLTATAEYTRDQLEEELSRTAFGAEVLRRRRAPFPSHPARPSLTPFPSWGCFRAKLFAPPRRPDPGAR